MVLLRFGVELCYLREVILSTSATSYTFGDYLQLILRYLQYNCYLLCWLAIMGCLTNAGLMLCGIWLPMGTYGWSKFACKYVVVILKGQLYDLMRITTWRHGKTSLDMHIQ